MNELVNKIYRLIELSKFYIYDGNEKIYLENLYKLANKIENGKYDKVVKNKDET